MNVAVTGASGHIGNVVCRTLIEHGYKVKALYHSDKSALEDLDLELVQGSVLNKDDLMHLMEGCEIVINCAAIISIHGDPTGIVYKTNTEGPQNVLEIALNRSVKKIIHLSTVHSVTELPHSEPYDETRPYKGADSSVYDHSKAIGEQILINGTVDQPIEVVIVRPSCVIGPHDFKPSKMGSALLDFKNGKVPFLPCGGYDLVDVRDVSESIVKVITMGKDREVYLLSGKYYDFKGLAAEIQKVTNRKMPRIVLPYWFLRLILPMASLYFRITGMSPSLTRESIDAVKHGHPDMNKSKAVNGLGHQVRSLEITLHDFYNWQSEHLKQRK
jgi:dihydroflavonol-4-reductase